MSLTKERVLQLLDVNLETGVLTWKFNYQRPDLIGKRAGWLNEGYWRLSIDGQLYYACEIIWLVGHGYIPAKTIDHENTNKADDRLTNLRLSTKAQNLMNSGINARNTSGFKGVSFCTSTGRWRASITVNKCSKNLGRYDTPEEAHEAWLAAAIEAFGAEFVRAA